MAAVALSSQSCRRISLLLLVISLALAVAAGLYHGFFTRPTRPKVVFYEPSELSDPAKQHSGTCTAPALDSLAGIIRTLWEPLVLPITAPEFVTAGGKVKKLPPPEKLVQREPLGTRLLILDLDNRDFTDEGGVFATDVPSWDTLSMQSAGFLSHYLYASIHGYSYKFLRVPKYKDRAPHWSKVIFTKEMLKEYDVVITLDYDVMFPNAHVPIEWLLNYWQIGPDTLVAMAQDPDREPNYDVRRKVNVNTGFIISRAGNLTQRLFQDWAECPSEKRYKGCAQWKDKIFHEQSGFSSFVRYDFLDGFSVDTHPNYIKTLPCDEANGSPKVASWGCSGQLVRHYWGDKHLTNEIFASNVMGAFTPLLVQNAYRKPGIVVDYRDKVLDGAQVLDHA
ncbi:hypothetical protein VTJ49DRAFT_6602 [Mycothermus thermophilus]|uniref:Nucleotide-diphospho-sugar transferase domain-containing protein n=1 Tax=Humicola insolens TaxID=85995 RepID=A0ABR3VIS1_HUMIN